VDLLLCDPSEGDGTEVVSVPIPVAAALAAVLADVSYAAGIS
jgi:hypothetical protein